MLSHALSMHYLCFIYALSMPGLWSIYGKNMNYLGGLEGCFSE